jgi:ESCRT-I complex subunit VPS28
MAQVPLFANSKERRIYDDLGDMYAIIRATETLEKAYARDILSADEYTKACTKLLSQFKSTEAALLPASTPFTSTKHFMELYTLDCPRAYTRLVEDGVPATTIHAIHENSGGGGDGGSSVKVAECVQFFITAMDALKLDLKCVDEIHPLLSDLSTSLNRISGVPKEFEPSVVVGKWLRILNGMRAVDEISDEEGRQLAMDLERSYGEFHRFLKEAHK